MSPRGRPPAGARLRRLLVMIPWITSRGRASLSEVAERFGLTVDEAVRDLELASIVGVPPYGPEDLAADLYIERGVVHARPGPVFRRPPRLSAGEAFAVLAAGEALLDVPGADAGGALATALGKLERAVGGRVVVDVDPPPFLDFVRDAASDGRRLSVEYYSAYRDETTTRVLDPAVVYRHRNGRWYVDDPEGKHFRVDRILAAHDTGERFEPARDAGPPDSVYDPGPSARQVEVLVPPSGRWVVETYPVAHTDEDDGRLRVTFTVVGDRWLERVLLRLGPEAEVVSPADLRDAGRDAARRVLARYGR